MTDNQLGCAKKATQTEDTSPPRCAAACASYRVPAAVLTSIVRGPLDALSRERYFFGSRFFDCFFL